MVPIWLSLGALCVCIALKRPYQYIFKRRWFVAVLAAGLAVLLLFEGAAVAVGVSARPQEPCRTLIVLGAMVDGEIPSRTLQYRLDTALVYLQAHPETRAVLSGGKGPGESISEAEAMRRYLVAGGIDEKRLLLEEQSTSTVENLRNSFSLLGPEGSQSVAVVSSAFHLLRAELIAWRLGGHVSGLGAKTDVWLLPNYYLREFLGVAHDVVLGLNA